MKFVGKKVIIEKGIDAGHEGYVVYEDGDAVTIESNGYFGAIGWYGRWYARKENIRVTDE